jgi:hypothetical protein
MATMGGSFSALVVIGIFSGDFTFAVLNLVIIVALFAGLIFFGRDQKKRIGDIHIGGKLHSDFKDADK